MIDVGLFAVLFIALALGWLLGKRKPKEAKKVTDKGIPKDYFRGLNHLLNDQHSEAIDAFVDSLHVNSETFEIHLTIGNLFRKKGEIQKAINVHQNLLSRPEISPREMRLVQLELASDFMSAGLLDRAERLLLNIAGSNTELQPMILTLLVDLYEFEQSWDKAIQIGSQLNIIKNNEKVSKRLAHYHCEIAQSMLDKEQFQKAYEHYISALDIDAKCVRAGIGSAEILIEQQRFREAIKDLKQIATQDKEFIPVILPQLKGCYDKVWNSGGYLKFLMEQNKLRPSASLMMEIAQHYARDDLHYAETFLIEQLRLHPTIKGFKELIRMQLDASQGKSSEHLQVIFELIEHLAQVKHKYLCRQCGFSGHQLHWQCPSCKNWGTVKPIHGLEGE
ncbi:lipopolysaccharide assembly protein LapB [Marinomonas sp. 2405UD68-3]|uniref:lipopolysaccharide assembly protein LapB n=1 Tax=Marinomonas sp. 2405UD68-3 TaxID=3391835 RepID=UPI0039C93912